MNLQDILKKHEMYLLGEAGGERAILSGADLIGADLSNANLRGASLIGADLSGADLRGASLIGADLSGADLRGADLIGANLSDADLCGANLNGADLIGADLSNADLIGANLNGADLKGAYLNGADFSDANLENCLGLGQQIVAGEGELIGYKKVSGSVILKLAIPKSARRVNAIGSRKCRADKAKVLAAFNLDGTPYNGITSFVSQYDPKFVYILGKEVIEPNFEPSDRIECAAGIHFFITFSEAREY